MYNCLKEFGDLTKYKKILIKQSNKHFILNLKPVQNLDKWWADFDPTQSQKRLPRLTKAKKYEILNVLALLTKTNGQDDDN